MEVVHLQFKLTSLLATSRRQSVLVIHTPCHPLQWSEPAWSSPFVSARAFGNTPLRVSVQETEQNRIDKNAPNNRVDTTDHRRLCVCVCVCVCVRTRHWIDRCTTASALTIFDRDIFLPQLEASFSNEKPSFSCVSCCRRKSRFLFREGSFSRSIKNSDLSQTRCKCILTFTVKFNYHHVKMSGKIAAHTNTLLFGPC